MVKGNLFQLLSRMKKNRKCQCIILEVGLIIINLDRVTRKYKTKVHMKDNIIKVINVAREYIDFLMAVHTLVNF